MFLPGFEHHRKFNAMHFQNLIFLVAYITIGYPQQLIVFCLFR